MNAFTWTARCAVLVAASSLVAGCSGGSSPAAPGSSAPVGAASSKKIHATLFIPNRSKTFAAILKAGRASTASARKPQYVSYATAGVAIASFDGSGNAIDSTAFSTNPTDNGSCMATTGGTSCTFTIGASAPTTTFDVSAYDTEPSVPTGGTGSVEPANADLLSTGSASESITAATSNSIALALGGVVNSLQFQSKMSSFVKNGGVVEFAGTSSGTVDFGYDALDAGGNVIVAGPGDPLANPVTVMLSESNAPDSPASSLSENGAAAASPVASSQTSDTFVVAYNGTGTGTTNANAYDATVTLSAGTATDAVSGSATPLVASESFDVSPLFLNAVAQSNDDFTTPTSSTPAALSYYTPASAGPYTVVQVVSAKSPGGETPTLDVTSTCTGFSFAADTSATYTGQQAFDALQSSPVDASPCIEDFTDAQVTIPLDLSAPTTSGGTITVPRKTAITFSPASPFTYSVTGPGNTPLSITSSDANPSYTITGCTATSNSGCYTYGAQLGNYRGQLDNYCLNASGYIGLDLSGDQAYVAYDRDDFTGETSDPNGQKSGDIVGCVLTISDGTSSATYSMTAQFGSGDASVRRVNTRLPSSPPGLPRPL